MISLIEMQLTPITLFDYDGQGTWIGSNYWDHMCDCGQCWENRYLYKYEINKYKFRKIEDDEVE